MELLAQSSVKGPARTVVVDATQYLQIGGGIVFFGGMLLVVMIVMAFGTGDRRRREPD
jgi:hypothetical protein